VSWSLWKMGFQGSFPTENDARIDKLAPSVQISTCISLSMSMSITLRVYHSICLCVSLYMSIVYLYRAQTPRTHTVANRILRNTLQQPIRQRRLLQQRSRGVGGGRSSQVRILNNTIHKLRQQVSSLQQVQVLVI